MFLKEMSPVQKAVITHLKRLGHYHGVSLRNFDNSMLDYLVTRIINDEMPFYRPQTEFEHELYFGRQGSNTHNRKWFKQFLKDREKWQLKEHGKITVLKKDKTHINGNCKKLIKAIEIQLMTHLNLKCIMTENEYLLYIMENKYGNKR